MAENVNMYKEQSGIKKLVSNIRKILYILKYRLYNDKDLHE